MILKNVMKWIYLSPHFDDVALSCGGLVWEQVRSGDKVSIWTVFAGEPPLKRFSAFAHDLHTRWGTGREAVSVRQTEDLLSCQRLGATSRHLSIPDAIYRRSPVDGSPLYTSDSELFGEIHAEELELLESIRQELRQSLPLDCELVCPLALGGHIDHRLVRIGAEGLEQQMWYYADFPYVVDLDLDQDANVANMPHRVFPVSESGLSAWIEAVEAYASQINSFWGDLDQMRTAIRGFWGSLEGIRLWQSG